MSKGNFDHAAIEDYWQSAWREADVYSCPDDVDKITYVLGMYPYPSGELHMGHVRNYTITDAYARYRRMRGDNILHPMGWDAFGLPAENAAKERDTNPRDWTFDCIDTMRSQMKAMGFGYDWDREITTCEPEYYRWNQYFFRRFYEEEMVERKDADVNWCPSCETVLADEQVEGENEVCWRCSTPIIERELAQWFLKITEYADELVDDIDRLDGWPDSVRQMQRNWIGRQEGTHLSFRVKNHRNINVFTTRVDTVYGATFLALAPDHSIVEGIKQDNQRIKEFVEKEADPDGDEPNGVPTKLTATNPVSGDEIPVYVADFVLSDVGTGALMGVPAHDERDHAFASKMNLDIKPVVAPATASETNPDPPDVSEEPYTEDGELIDSGEYSGLDSETARERITAQNQKAKEETQYRLRDWGISRQRYWGTPIPVVHCNKCGPVLVPEEDLPVELPEFINTTGNPLEAAEDWKETVCPECGREAVRETDTMDTFMDSSWYFLRYISPDNDEGPFKLEKANNWMPVNQYVGGIEHAVMHLLYARFFTKLLADYEGLECREPFERLLAQGMVQLKGEKMSKSKGNVVSPQRIVEEYGADTARLFMMQAASPEREFNWTEEGVRSTNRLLSKLIDLVESNQKNNLTENHRPVDEYVVKEVDSAVVIASGEYDQLSFDTALREVQDLIGTLRQYQDYTKPNAETYEYGLKTTLQLLAPVAPHITEELYERMNGDGFIINTDWPKGDLSTTTVDRRRSLIKNTREDVRQIIDVADIEDPSEIQIAVAPEWKYQALETAVKSDTDNLVSELMSNQLMREQGEEAASYAKSLQKQQEALFLILPPEDEYNALTEAKWLVEREFNVPVAVVRGDETASSFINDAEPGRPAIHIEE